MNKKCLTVVIFDIDNFKEISRAKSMEEVLRYLQRFYRYIGDQVIASKGRILDYQFDSVIVAFKKAKAALTTAEKIINEDKFKVKCSLATGYLYECSIGHPSCKRNGVFGEVINTAMRLLYNNPPSNINICETTKKLIAE